ncbi:MAG TPA: SDR family NAD(P)-dependent oxidoreductase [Solirubrobacteraceae bacterium]|nr:SDR family NAD(P)-dependent oxidoreductase [Solirubrobacteraceae bacterium]
MIVVTGAGGSLGPYVARALAEAGNGPHCCDTDVSRLEGVPGAHHAVDLLDEAATREWAESLDGVTGVVHLVGGWRGGKPLSDSSLDDWALLHDLLIRTVQHTTRAFAPALKSAGDRGRYVLVSSRQAQAPTSTNAAYAAAKAAAEAWTLAYADELSETGGTANILVVNAIVTPEMREQNPDKAYATFTDARHMADAIAWLVSDAAVAMNGQRLSLHG